MISFKEAISILENNSKIFQTEEIRLEDALGRILAEDLYADRDYPPFNRAAMDGYALRMSDWKKGIRKYTILETIFTAQAPKKKLTQGTCYKIMTGAATPKIADLIIAREEAEEEYEQVTLFSINVKKYQNIAKQAEDIKKDKIILSRSLKCNSQVITLLATIGKVKLLVYKLPETTLITTGNEVVKPSANIQPFEIRNSNLFMLKAMLDQWRIQPIFCEHVADDKEKLVHTLSRALQAELIIINGGVSAGDADFIPTILKELGVEILFHKVSIRPGKPLLLAKTNLGGLIFALPGNPLSCLTTFSIFVEHYLSFCSGHSQRTRRHIPLEQNRSKKHKLTEFFPVKMNDHGKLQPISFNGSGDITSYVYADGLAMQSADSQDILRNQIVEFFPFSP